MKPVILIVATAIPLSADAQQPFAFRDVADEMGLLPHLADMHAHAAAWGDANGDGRPDLYVGTFVKGDSKANRLMLSRDGKFAPDDQPALRLAGRASGSVFADLDADGDLDLYVSNLGGGTPGPQATGNHLFRNDGGGTFTDVTADSGAAPGEFRGRSCAVLDYDGDGKLDLLLGESTFYGSKMRSRLLRNLGDLKFEDVSDDVGLPEVPALGVAVGDVNLDGKPDVFLAANYGSCRLLLNDGGKFREAPGSPDIFQWPDSEGENSPCGACFGDVDGDGRPDLVVGHHYDRPWVDPVPVRLYLNRPGDGEAVRFEEVTAECGLTPLGMKAPHVEVRDFDNDGRPDVYTSVVKFADGKPHPVIFRNLGNEDGLPRFAAPAWEVNDFPTEEDKALRRSGDFYDKMLRDGKVIYTAAAPSADFDGDGRLDLFVSSWWREKPAMLLRNETKAGHWLRVRVNGGNPMGIGAKVFAYEKGKPDALISWCEVNAGYGYSSGQQAVAHLGLGDHDGCDLEVVFPHGRGKTVRPDVKADQEITVQLGNGK